MTELHLEDVGKTYASGVRALEDVTLTVAPGECLALVGPSGCGKTTLLRVIAGLEEASEGEIRIDKQVVNAVPAHRRGVAMLFQRPALILNHTVRQNLRWAWTLEKPWKLFGNRSHDADLLRVARLLDLEHTLDRPTGQLSGGQQQRVALGRCLLRQAKLLLLDEPLGHLDAPLRADLRRAMHALISEQRLTMLHVTHDPEEAFTVGDRVAVMQEGRIVQIDAPGRMRRHPASRFVAELVHYHGGGLNFLSGEVVREVMDTFIETVFGRWPMSVKIVQELRESLCQGENFHPGEGKVHIMVGVAVRDVHCSTAPRAGEDENRIVLPVAELECAGAGTCVIGSDARGRWIGQAGPDERFERGQAVTMAFSLAQAYWFDLTTGRTLVTPTG
ncbi:MAG: ABC transporter ATP-binding protein [Gemmataceae bacterium]|nr:ABC transporter ATP-binding protein [Gemmataceae bacterium]